MEPDKPQPSDCCGSGCSPCVFDIYDQRLKSFRENQLSVDTRFRRDLLSETRFKRFRLIHKEQLTQHVYLYRFCPDIGANEASEISGFLPYDIGQHLILRCDVKLENECSKELNNVQLSKSDPKGAKNIGIENQQIIRPTRAYTPLGLSKQEKDCCFKIFAKLYKNGVGSEYLKRLQIGDISLWRGPYGQFNYKPNKFRYIVMFCIGSGLAPMIPIINYVLSNDNDETLLELIYGVKSIEHVIMRDSLRCMTQYWNFTLQYFFSENKIENNSIKFGESFKNKRIDLCSVKEFIEGKELKQLLVLVCGTDSFNSFIKNHVFDLGVDPGNIFLF